MTKNKRTHIYQHGVNKKGNTKDRATNDYYSTPEIAVKHLLQYEKFNKNILEPCIGGGAIAEILKKYGYQITGIDIINRGYPDTIITDFLQYNKE